MIRRSGNNFEIRIGYSAEWLEQSITLYQAAGLGHKNPGELDRALRASYCVVTCWRGEVLCGIGRAISDGVYYASIFDVAVHPKKQRQGVGRQIMDSLYAVVGHCCVYLTSTFGNEGFYHKLGYRRHRTALARYPEHRANSPYLDPPDM